MSTALLLLGFFCLLFAGVPIAVSMGLTGIIAIVTAGLGILSVPVTVYTGIAKYPLLAVPMFILAGVIFERSGMAERLLNLAIAIVGRGRASLPVIAIVVCILMGGISGAAAAIAAAVAGVMTNRMVRAGYPRPFIAAVIGAGAATDILVPPSVALIIYSLLVPQASVPAMFAAGIIPGTLAGLALIIPTIWLSRKITLNALEEEPRPPFFRSLYEALWPLIAKVVILGGLRYGIFTPTEAGVIAVAYSWFVGQVVYRTLSIRDLRQAFVNSAELSGVILIVFALASVLAFAVSTLGIIDPVTAWIIALPIGEYGVLVLIIVLLIVIGIFVDGVSTLLIMVPMLMPIVQAYHWDPVWFGIIMMVMLMIGAITPPMAITIIVSCNIVRAPIEATLPWIGWSLVSMLCVLTALIVFPDIVLWLPRYLGFHG